MKTRTLTITHLIYSICQSTQLIRSNIRFADTLVRSTTPSQSTSINSQSDITDNVTVSRFCCLMVAIPS